MAAETFLKTALTISLLMVVLAFADTAHAKTFYVDDDGPADFNNIQAAIDAAVDGDTIEVHAGIYHENLVIGSSHSNLNLLGSGADLTTIDGSHNGRVVCINGAKHIKIEGFSVQNGFAEVLHDSWDGGGGIVCRSGAIVTIARCIVTNNSIGPSPNCRGGGIYCEHSTVTLLNCQIKNNSATGNGGGIAGSLLTITDCIIVNNVADRPSQGAQGGGLALVNGTVTNCIIARNYAAQQGGGADNCPASFVNCLIYGNFTRTSGGGLLLPGPVLNCTIVNNTASGGQGGGIHYLDTTKRIENCIIWGNKAGLGDQLFGFGATVSYCNVEDGWIGEGNINADPLFVDAAIRNYRLLPGSPCIDAGDPNYIAGPNETDLDGKPRVLYGRIDMGAYEYHPRIIHVDDDANGANDGSSWADAYNYLQDALADANSSTVPVEIHVAQGTYKPDQGAGITPGDRKATFQLNNGITLKGGYAGFVQPDPNARDVALYETILTGDLAGNDIELNDPCDFRHDPSRDDNSYHVVTGSVTDETAVLDGFTITAGNADRADVDIRGAGLLNYPSGSPTLFHCTFRDNIAIIGGGVYNKDGSNPRLSYCTFYNNFADSHGGGIYNALSSSPTLMHCTFSANIAASGSGGAIGNFNFCSPALINCTFSGNYAAYSGGGMFNAFSSNSTLINCIFIGNVAGYGGGGGMRNRDSSPTLINCTFGGNRAEKHYRGGGLRNDQSSPSLRNCILWGNYDYSGGSEESVQMCTDGGTPIVNYCCIQGWTGILGGTDNFDADPFFVELGYWQDPCNTPYYPWDDVWIEGDYHLLPDSTCIDAGDPNYIAEPNETDLDGRPRVMGGRIDMGAYESPIFAEARIVPQTINLASKGNWITSYIWLPDEYNVADIEPNSIFLEDEIQPEQFSVDEQQQLATARFSREDVLPILEVGDINLRITGRLADGTDFEGTDTIKVIDKAGKN